MGETSFRSVSPSTTNGLISSLVYKYVELKIVAEVNHSDSIQINF